MPNNSEKNYKEWIKKAEEDEGVGKQILKGNSFFAIACFHFQQMAEKYLKGMLVFYGKDFPKVHDLLELESLLMNIVPNIQNIHDDLKFLNRYYIETRYPGDYPEFTLPEAKQACESAMKIKEFVFRNLISKDTP